MTIKEYATSRGVSYETVRRQVAGHKKKELKGHIKYQGNQSFLDDYAIEFLDQHRQPRNVVVTANNEETQRELEKLHNQVHQLQAELLKRADRITELLEKNSLLLEDNAKNKALLLLADKEHDELQTVKQELETSKEELNKYQKTIFGLYKKVD